MIGGFFFGFLNCKSLFFSKASVQRIKLDNACLASFLMRCTAKSFLLVKTIEQLWPNTHCFRTFQALFTWFWTCRPTCRPPCLPPCRPPFTFVSHHVGHHVGHLVGHLVHLHVGHHVHLLVGHHVSHHFGHHNVDLTLCEGSEILTEWKSETIMDLPTDRPTD